MVFRPKEDVTVGCFGKLPAKGDFIRHNAAKDEVHALDEWLSRGLEHAKAELGSRFSSAYKGFFGLFAFSGLSQPGAPERVMLGAWAASGDSAGRLYPMTVYALFPAELLAPLRGTIPVVLFAWYRQAFELVTQGRSLSAEEFIARTQALTVPERSEIERAMADYDRWLRTTNIGAFWETACGAAAAGPRMVEDLRATLTPMRGPEAVFSRLGLVLPIGSADAYAASVWGLAVAQLLQQRSGACSVFWKPRERLLLHVGQVPPSSFVTLLDTTCIGDHLVVPSGIDATGSEDGGPPSTHRTVFEFLQGELGS